MTPAEQEMLVWKFRILEMVYKQKPSRVQSSIIAQADNLYAWLIATESTEGDDA